MTKYVLPTIGAIFLLALGIFMGAFVLNFERPIQDVTPNAEASGEPAVMPRGSYQVHVDSVYDGDTFKFTWDVLPPELSSLSIRVRGIDTPEMRGDCPSERARAMEARDYVTRLIAANDNQAVIRNLAWDKYGGRIDADVSVGSVNLARDLVSHGYARVYLTGARQGWC